MDVENPRSALMDKLSPVSMYANFALDVFAITFFFVWGVLRRLGRLVWRASRKSLKKEIVLVTGGSNGIGREMLLELARREKDITLVCWDLDSKGNQTIKSQLESLGVTRVFTFDVDITDDTQVAIAAARVRQEVGEVTMLFNNAGIAGKFGHMWDLGTVGVRKVLEVNTISHFSMLREFLPSMIQKNSGHIVATCSVLGFLWGKKGAPYVASKHALKACMECLKDELRFLNANNVMVSLAYPSLTCTDILTGIQLQPQKYPFLAKLMQPSFVASQIIDGVLRNEEHIYIPGSGRFVHTLMSLLPAEVTAKVLDVLSIDPVAATAA